LSDEQIEIWIMDRLSFQKFVGLTLADKVPDANTIWDFREAIGQETLDGYFTDFWSYLKGRGIEAREGKVVDATFVEVARQRNSRQENEAIKGGKTPEGWENQPHKLSQKDVDARWTKKGNEAHYGYKEHVKVDAATKLIENYEVTDAAVHDSQPLDRLVSEGDGRVHGDRAYRSKGIETKLTEKKIEIQIFEKGYRNRPLSEEQKASNRMKSKIRCRIEHVFGYETNSMGDFYLEYIGKVRVTKAVTLIMLVALFLACFVAHAEEANKTTETRAGNGPQAVTPSTSVAAGLLDQGRFRVDMASYLSQHDVVYLAPALGPDDGLPLGNGDFCVRQWNEDTLNLSINKSDVWGAMNQATEPKTIEEYRELLATHRERLEVFQKTPDLGRWKYTEDWQTNRPPRKTKATITVPRPLTLGEVALKINGVLERSQFEERLNLYDGAVSLKNGKTDALTYVDEGRALAVTTVRDRSGASGRKLELWHWNPQAFGATNGMVWLEHREADQTGYALVVAVAGVSAEGKVTEAGHRAVLTLADAGKGSEQEFRILIAAVSTSESPTPLVVAKAIIENALKENDAQRLAKHNAYWRDFWSQSFVDFSDKYLENLWYLNLYCMGCGSRGRYPMNFENGWFNARDFWMWGAYWQFNEQSMHFSLDMANHPELMEPYTRWIRDSLPAAKLQTMAQFGLDGAQYSHCMSVRGQPFNGPGDMTKYVLSTCGLYSLYLWQHYEYTLDKAFLKERAYPVMLEAGKFYHGYLKNQIGPDGKFIIYPGHPIEQMDSTPGNATIDIAVIRALAKVLLEAEQVLAVAKPMTATWRELQDRLPPYPVKDGVFLLAEHYEGPEFRILPESNAYDALPAWCSFPVGWKWSKEGEICAGGNGMGTQFVPVFPAGEIGLSSDPAVLETARNTYAKVQGKGALWSPINISGARLGLRDQTLSNVVAHVRNFQITPQGFMSYVGNREGLINIQEKGIVWAFDRMDKPRYDPYFEVLGVIVTAVGYSLLDSLDGIIRAFPALPLTGDARIVMRATGAFMVTAEMRDGDIAYVTILSEQGGPCRVANPWDSGAVRVRKVGKGQTVLSGTTAKVLAFPTVKGGVYTVEREAKPADSYPVVEVRGARQTGPRLLPPVMIGMPREGWKCYEGPGPKAIKERK
jgi:IS5 family transposase